MRIALDAMGGDHGSDQLIAGALEAVCVYGHQVVLVGDQQTLQQLLDQQIKQHLIQCSGQGACARDRNEHLAKISIVHTTQVVGMEESPMDGIRKKKDSSIRVAFQLLRQHQVEAVVSAGNSGATLAAAVKEVGRLPGISRPGIAGIFPTLKQPLVMMDVGANVDCRPQHLFQFAIMATAFSKALFGIEHPKVALLSIGEEGGKGNALVKSTHEILRQSTLNYIGNVEGRDVFRGDVDVMVCDGFVGNICLKLSEGLAEALVSMLREELKRSLKSKVGYLLTRKAYANIKKRTDYAEYGGGPLLGFNGTGIICHGRSNAMAIKNAIRVAGELVNNKMNERIIEMLGASEALVVDQEGE
ncbi:MAG: phosphate acyltransferase PlsX [Proteobacteria bacterium]|nr:phosphate acyltransferase PlsX [Desulfobulbaceae bacterium]MBU4153050.1 phosphate acyltransferase PlsX [Pseudomonadota bacterium]MDP2105600.1 phosphate acyltransferase PlsX [Desulfobulbaceae bacterium]